MAKITNVNIKTEFITLGQMLKFVDLKMRGKKLYPGTRIEIDDSMIFEIKNDN